MKKIIIVILLAAVLPSWAQNTTNTTNKVDFSSELSDATAKLKKKFDAGKTSPADLSENISSISDLIAKYQKTGNRDQLARLYLLDAHIYADGMTNITRARAIWTQVTRDFPGTLAARGASMSLAKYSSPSDYEPDPNIPEGLNIGQRFPAFDETALSGQSISTKGERGKVLLIDFWATWCGPCRAEMPNVIATYGKYHAQGFDIIGVSLDSNSSQVSDFTQANQMPWLEYFDGKGWENKLAKKYGVEAIPTNYLLDRRGVIIGKELRGEQLMQVVAKGLATN